jgi:6-phosphogluconate dehydrogenase (decarboxylating)
MQWGLAGHDPRFASRHDLPPAMRDVSALKNRFGGHAVQRAPRSG